MKLQEKCIQCHMLHNGSCSLLCDICSADITSFNYDESANLLHRQDIKVLYQDLYFDSLWAINWYHPPLKEWLTGLKFHNQIYYKVILQTLIKQHLTQASIAPHWHQPDIAIIVPLHPYRLVKRGYNQVAQVWLDILNIPLFNGLKRIINTKAQSELNKTQRKSNIANAFTLSGDLSGKSVVIIDDIVTTGTTVSHIAKLLKENGAIHVSVWATCITPISQHS